MLQEKQNQPNGGGDREGKEGLLVPEGAVLLWRLRSVRLEHLQEFERGQHIGQRRSHEKDEDLLVNGWWWWWWWKKQ